MSVSRRGFLTTAAPAAASAAVAAAVQPVTSQAAAAGLINADAVRAALPRLFSGEWSEVFGELLQNSQRAKATSVHTDISQLKDELWRLTWSDDGCGLAGDLESFRKLLAIGESGWDEQTRAQQSPLGLGLHALLAREDVRTVTLASGGQQISIDRARWWTESAYYSNWPSLLRPSKVAAGFRLDVEFHSDSWQNSLEHCISNAARGYGDLLQVTCNGEVVEGLTREQQPWRVGEYEGERVEMWLPEPYRNFDSVVVNWYGQLVSGGLASELSASPASAIDRYCVVVTVRKGCPFALRSPSRLGVIRNKQWSKFVLWLRDQYADVLQATERPSTQAVSMILTTWPELEAKSRWLLRKAWQDDEFQPVCVTAQELAKGWVIDKTVALEADEPVSSAGTETRLEEVPSLAWLLLEQSDRPAIYAGSAATVHVKLQKRVEYEELGSIHVYEQAKIVIQDADEKTLLEFPLEEALAIPTDRSSYLDGASGYIVLAGETEPRWADLLDTFFEAYDDSESSSEQQSNAFGDEVADLLRVMFKQKIVRSAESIWQLIQQLQLDEPGTTLQLVRGSDNHVCGFEVHRPDQEPEEWLLQ